MSAYLSGTVGSAAEKTEAFFDAWVAGVCHVDVSDLEVSRWARDDDLRRDKYAVRGDGEIEKAVEAALGQDPRVETRVADALQRDAVVESFEVRVDADAGIVTLTGGVDSRYERARADLVAGLVPGVVAVENRLDVHDADVYVYDPFLDDYDFALYDWGDRWEPRYTMRSDTEIEQEVEDQLWWSPFVDANEVQVSVADGVVTLTGTVDSWSERHFAASNAFEAGASWVRNRLEVSQAS